MALTKTSFKKGHPYISNWTGHHHSLESKKKMRLAKLGKKQVRSIEGKISFKQKMSGEKCWRWKGGITSEDRLQRIKFRISLQKKVFQKDNYTCQICGSRKNLQVDHIQSWKDFIELRFSIDNCRTLCAKCHYKITFGKPMPENIKGWGHNLIERIGIST
jgi:5-methylcytosine-specific restriction endonuclease McrA